MPETGLLEPTSISHGPVESPSLVNESAANTEGEPDEQLFQELSMAAGQAAHDINNLLSVCMGYSDILYANPEELPEGGLKDIEKIFKSCQDFAQVAQSTIELILAKETITPQVREPAFAGQALPPELLAKAKTRGSRLRLLKDMALRLLPVDEMSGALVAARHLEQNFLENQRSRGYCESIIEAANKILDICKDWQAAFEGGKAQAEQIDLRFSMEHWQKLVKAQAATRRPGVKLEYARVKESFPIFVPRTQMFNVLQNLVVNACDAFEGQKPGVIKLEVKREQPPAELVDPDATAGKFVAISVTDNGMGMSPEVLKRIFETFYTTKAPGKGTGLGLASVKKFLDDNRGFVGVESQPGQGSKFTIYLPENSSAQARPPLTKAAAA